MVLDVSPSVQEGPIEIPVDQKGIIILSGSVGGEWVLDKMLIYCVEGRAEVLIHSVQRVFILIYYRGSAAQNAGYVYVR